MSVAGIALLAASCGFLVITPFPSFMGGAEYVLELPGLTEYTDITGRNESGTRYDLAVIGTGPAMRVLLKVEPPSSVGGGYEYRGRIIVFDEDLSPVGVIEPETTLDYLSRPYSYTHNANEILIGFSVFNDTTFAIDEKVTQHGLTGFVVTKAGTTSTHLFSTPSGAFSGFELHMRNYLSNNPWGVTSDVTTVNILPLEDWPPADDPDFSRLGFQLLGVDYQESPSDEITFLFSQPSEQYIIAVRATLADVLSGETTSLLSSSSDTGVIRLAGLDRPGASVDDLGFFLQQRNGWFVRYEWDAEGAVERIRVVGDTSFARRYAFYPAGDTFYRFDPAALTLTRIKGWW
jgi:hypothetical protein